MNINILSSSSTRTLPTKLRALIAGTVILSSSAQAQEWQHRWQLSGHPSLQLSSKGVEVVVEAGSANAIKAVLEVEGSSMGSPVAKIDQHQDGDVVNIHLDAQPYFGVRHIRLRIQVPQNLEAELRSGNGSIALHGLHGRLRLATEVGDIQADNIDGTLEAATKGGAIKIQGRFDLLNLHTQSGPIDAEVSLGSRLISEWQIESEGGSIVTKIPPSLAAEIEARSESGKIQSELPLIPKGFQSKNQVQGTLGIGGPTLLVWSRNGSILLTK